MRQPAPFLPLSALVIVATAMLFSSCVVDDGATCRSDKECNTGQKCNTEMHKCELLGAGTGGSGGMGVTGRGGAAGGSGGVAGGGSGGTVVGAGGGVVDGGPGGDAPMGMMGTGGMMVGVDSRGDVMVAAGDAGGSCAVAKDCLSGACVGGRCVECVMDSQCPAGKPLCSVGNKCVGCAELGASDNCMKHGAGTPVCDAISGRCVECSTAAQCMPGTKPVCVMGACTSCAGAPGQCGAMKCEMVTGACVECTNSSHCVGDAGKPICNVTSNKCTACGAAGIAADACGMKNAAAPGCSAGGACVECTVSAQCGNPGKPICDTAMNKCVPCGGDGGDGQCAARGGTAGICAEGTCSSETETLFVKKGATCPGLGTSAMPFCGTEGLMAALSVTPGKRAVVISGAHDSFELGATAAPRVTIVGRDVAGIAVPNGRAGISVKGGDYVIRNLVVTGGFDATVSHGIKQTAGKLSLVSVTLEGCGASGLVAEGGTLTMNRCIVRNNKAGGVRMKGASYDIMNTVFDRNLAGAEGPVGFGGAYLVMPSTGTGKFRFNTIVGNDQTGVVCTSTPSVFTGLLLANNTGGDHNFCGVPNTDTPTFSSRSMPPMIDGTYHLTGTNCVDLGGSPECPPDDLDGERRPKGAACDCGADESK